MIGAKGYDAAPFRNSITSLRITSKDDGGGKALYMTESNLRVYNFDKVMHRYISSLPKGKRPEGSPSSVDALVRLTNDDCVLVEFKNGVLDKKAFAQVREKVLSSVLVLGDLLGYSLEEICQHVDFVLVYNEKKNKSGRSKDVPPAQSIAVSESRRSITKGFSRKGSKESALRNSTERHGRPEFGMRKKLKGFCAREVRECTESEFDNEFVANWEHASLSQ